MALKQHGADRFGRIVERNIEQAQRVAERLAATGRAEILAPVVLDIVCFRVRPEGVPEERLDAFQRELLLRVQESGEAMPSNTTIRGVHCMRLALCNHRTTDQDLDRFVGVLMRMADELACEPEAWGPTDGSA